MPLTCSSLALKAPQCTIDRSTFRNVVCLQGCQKMPHCLFGSKDTERDMWQSYGLIKRDVLALVSIRGMLRQASGFVVTLTLFKM